MPQRARPSRRSWPSPPSLGACQDYNFSPVKYAVIQPGTERVTLSEISTADILFVVDDSGSMGLKQQKLAASFDAFVASLQDEQRGPGGRRARAHRLPHRRHHHLGLPERPHHRRLLRLLRRRRRPAGLLRLGEQPAAQGRQGLRHERASAATGNTCRTDCLGRGGELTCCSAAGHLPGAGQPGLPGAGRGLRRPCRTATWCPARRGSAAAASPARSGRPTAPAPPRPATAAAPTASAWPAPRPAAATRPR